MKGIFQLSPRVLRIIGFAGGVLGLMTLMRVAFALTFSGRAENYSLDHLLTAFIYGLRFDLRITVLLMLPLFILTPFRVLSWTSGLGRNRAWHFVYLAALSFTLLVYFFDFGYYEYLESRINATIFDFLNDPLISFQMMRETYNLWLLTGIFLTAAFGIHVALKRFLFSPLKESAFNTSRAAKTAQGILIAIVIVLSVHNSLGQYPLRWSQVFFAQNNFIAYTAMNPLHYLFDTMENREITFRRESVEKHYETVANYLGVREPDKNKLRFQRPVEIKPLFDKPNIVYIVMESMAAHKTGVFGNPANASPSLDALAREGWLFKHFYVPTEGTARSFFCLLTGVPDINAKSTSSRNPIIIDQHTVLNAFKDYEKFYFIGGDMNWGNIRGVYQNNVEGLRIFEEGDFDRPKTDVWGLSDLDLFRETARILDEQPKDKPFIAIVQAASYHRPYTIPEEHGDFQWVSLSDDELARYGFTSNEEYNSFRFADYSLGEFFRLAGDKEFFKNTLFVIHGDHGLPHQNAEHLSEGYRAFGLNRFHTPLVFYSPLIDDPKEWNNLVTEPDILPTLAGITGHEFTNTTLGRNIFALEASESRYSFSYVYYSDPLQIMLYDQQFIAVGTEKGIESLHQYTSDDPKRDLKSEQPEKFAEMSELLMGIFETSKYLMYNNPKLRYSTAKSSQ